MNKLIFLSVFAVLLEVYSCVDAYSQEITVEAIPTNSILKNDFAPFVIDSMLYFTSNRKHEWIRTYINQNNEGLYRLYQAAILSNDDFGKESAVHAEQMSKLNTSSFASSEDGSKIFITQNQYSTLRRSKAKENLLGIFMITNTNDKWSRPIPFPYNSRRTFSNGQPTVTLDGNTLFYVSNQPGGYGETDIYQSNFKNGEWTKPMNIGNNVNTVGHELFPFYHSSGKLYFSSNNHGANGGLDIFYTTYDGVQWTTPVRLDLPINSESDDFSCYILPEETEGFFASNRSGNDDVYKYSSSYPSFPDAKPQQKDNFCFTLFENGSFQSDTLPYKFQWHFGDGESAFGLEVRHCFLKEGLYKVHLNVIDTLANVDLYTVAQYELNLERKKQVYILAPDTVPVNIPVKFSAENSVLKDFKVSQYYWSFGDGNRAKGVAINHLFRKKGVYTIVCGVISQEDVARKMSSTRQIVVTD